MLVPCSGSRGTYKLEHTNLFIDKFRSKQNLLQFHNQTNYIILYNIS